MPVGTVNGVRDLPARPRRSVLYMPAANPRALAKATSLPADALILDLEDAVAPDAKATARSQAVAAVRAGGYGRRELAIRVNGLATPWGADDLAAVAAAGADAVVLPKVEGPEAVLNAVQRLAAAGAPADLALWCMIETPRGVLAADAVAGAHPNVRCLVMGTSDLTRELHAGERADRLAMLPSLGLVLLAARANGAAALDGVHLDLADAEGLAAACR